MATMVITTVNQRYSCKLSTVNAMVNQPRRWKPLQPLPTAKKNIKQILHINL